MGYELVVTPHAGFVWIKVRGINTSDTIRAYLSEVARRSAENGWSAVLVEEHLDGPQVGIVDLFEIVSDISAVAPRNLRVAMVNTNPEHHPSQMRFAETVAINRGVNVRMFASVEEGRRWLTGSAEAQDLR